MTLRLICSTRSLLETRADDVCLIRIDEPDSKESLMGAAKEFGSDTEEETGMVSSADSSFSRPAAEDGYERVSELFTIKVFGIGTPMRRDYYRKNINGLEVTVMLQTEAEIRPGLQRGLKLILDSFAIGSAKTEAPKN